MEQLDIFTELNFNLIQSIRLAHALVEAGCRLHVSPEVGAKLEVLHKIFGMQYVVAGEGVPILRGLLIDHRKPETRIGVISRPLIFPIVALEHCRKRWPQVRRVNVSFSGLLTDTRRTAINEWLSQSDMPIRIRDPSKAYFAERLVRKLRRRLGMPAERALHLKGVKIIPSDDGRRSLTKAWNVDYYLSLLESEFVLCPDGDFGKEGIAWTYRFFESVLCGAIPVIQNSCDAYEGFRFRLMKEPLGSLTWSYEDAKHNFELAMKRLTVPREEILSEVRRLLAAGRNP